MRAVAVLALLLAAGCKSSTAAPVDPAVDPAVESAPHGDPTPSAAGAARPWDRGAVLESNDRTYRVVYKLAKEPFPRGEPFSLDVWVFAADAPDHPLGGVTLAADGAMPQHGHGMNRVARVSPAGDGHFRVEGLLFHMPGKWELYFDVTEGARTERAQADIDLE